MMDDDRDNGRRKRSSKEETKKMTTELFLGGWRHSRAKHFVMASAYSPRLGPGVLGLTLNSPSTQRHGQKYKKKKKQFEALRFWGRVIIIGSMLFFVFNVYCIVASKLLPSLGNPILDFLKTDKYYSILFPLLIPTVVFAIYLNWLSMKFYRHN